MAELKPCPFSQKIRDKAIKKWNRGTDNGNN